MRILAVSPHLDDAVLSYGGHLARSTRDGHEALVYTVFAGSPQPPYSPIAESFHTRWELTGDTVAPRRLEDSAAHRVLGTTPVHGPFLDSIYRRNVSGGWLIDGVDPMEYAADDECELVDEIADAISALIKEHAVDEVASCLAVGNHVDHRRTRQAVLRAVAHTGSPLTLWDDFPYVAWGPGPAPPPLPAGSRLDDPVAESVDAAAWAVKERAVACYRSQLAMLESGGTPIAEQYRQDCARRRSSFAGVAGFYEVVRRAR